MQPSEQFEFHAGLAQLVEQLICNHQVADSNSATGTIYGKRTGKAPSLATLTELALETNRDNGGRPTQLRTEFRGLSTLGDR